MSYTSAQINAAKRAAVANGATVKVTEEKPEIPMPRRVSDEAAAQLGHIAALLTVASSKPTRAELADAIDRAMRYIEFHIQVIEIPLAQVEYYLSWGRVPDHVSTVRSIQVQFLKAHKNLSALSDRQVRTVQVFLARRSKLSLTPAQAQAAHRRGWTVYSVLELDMMFCAAAEAAAPENASKV